MPFQRVLALYEMYMALFKIWTRIVVPTSHDNKQYVTRVSYGLNVSKRDLCAIVSETILTGCAIILVLS